MNTEIFKSKKFLAFGAVGVVCVILLVVSSGLGKKKETTTPDQTQTYITENEQSKRAANEFKQLQNEGNPLIVGEVKETPIKVETREAEKEVYEKVIPSPSFVTESKDTLVWEGGIYVKIADVKKTKPDTLVVDGKVFIEKI